MLGPHVFFQQNHSAEYCLRGNCAVFCHFGIPCAPCAILLAGAPRGLRGAPRGAPRGLRGGPRGSAGWSELGHFCQFVQSDTLSVHLCLFPTLSVAPAFWMHFSVSFSLNSAQMLRIIIGLCTFQPIQLVCVLIGPHTHEIINLSWISA